MLEIGTKVKDFSWTDENGVVKKLSDYSGHKVGLYFYPSDDTPGCTAQACSIRDNFDNLKDEGIVVLGISHNSLESHRKFKEKYHLPFEVISDSDLAISKYFGTASSVPILKMFIKNKRITFLIDENQVLVKIIKDIDTKDHANQIMSEFKNLK